MFKMIEATSSSTPSTVENSCKTPSIWIEVTAAPGKDESKIRRKEFPKVVPYPRSRGSTTNLPNLASLLISTVSIFGFSISSIHFTLLQNVGVFSFHQEFDSHRLSLRFRSIQQVVM